MRSMPLVAVASALSLMASASAGSIIASEDFEGPDSLTAQFTDTYGTGATSPSPAGDSPDIIGVVSDASTSPMDNSINQGGASNATNYFLVEDADGLYEVFFDSLQNIDTSDYMSLSLDFDFATGGDFEDPDFFGVTVNGVQIGAVPGNALQFQADGTFRPGGTFPAGVTGGFVSVSDLLGMALDLSVFDQQIISIGFQFQTNADGEDIAIDNIALMGTPVPVPAAGLLFGGALLAGLARRLQN